MAKLDGSFDLSSLKLEGKTLDSIPDFTKVEMEKLEKAKAELLETRIDSEHKKISDEIDRLTFLKVADSYRDQVNDGRFPEFDEKHALTALRAYARVLQKKF